MHHHHPIPSSQPTTTPSTSTTTANVSTSGLSPSNAGVVGGAGGNTNTIGAVGGNGSANTNTGTSSHAVQQRRRKKRPNYGTRTVEVRRGYNGFGFTISGQQPCRLSCIVANSPADQAGLRAGDFLISVNGLNVSKLPHETVVQLIGNSFGSIRMQIAENYYSDSSDEENAALMLQQQSTITGMNGVLSNQLGLCAAGTRTKPRFLHHKAKMHRLRNSPQKKRSLTLQQQQQHQQLMRAEQLSKCVSALKPMELQKLRPLMEDLPLPVGSGGGGGGGGNGSGLATATSFAAASPAKPAATTSASTAATPASNTNSAAADLANVNAMARAPAAALEYRAIVGYLGTIEMPKQISHSSKLQTVRSCIRKLRQEKRQPNMVLMTILPDCLRLQSANGNTLAIYASERLNYVSSSSESENRFFGLVTSAVHTSQMDEEDEDDDEEELNNEPRNVRNNNNNNNAGQARMNANGESNNANNPHVSISNSCHVFVVDTKLCEHQAHVPRAAEFRIHCTRDPISSLCLEFPNNSEYVVNLIRSMYTMRVMPPIVRQYAAGAAEIRNGNRGGGAGIDGPAVAAHSPQPSNHSEISTTTSNSDSGIGFHNDCNNISDRILVVDFPGAPELRMRPLLGQRPIGIFNNFENVADKRPAPAAAAAVHAMAEASDRRSTDSSANNSSTTPHTSQLARPNLLDSFNLIKSPTNALQSTRSCDDVLALVERSGGGADGNADAGFQSQSLAVVGAMPPHASMDDISMHSTAPSTSNTTTISCSAADDHLFLHPAACMLAMQHQRQRPTASQVYTLLQDCLSRARIARQSFPQRSSHGGTSSVVAEGSNSNNNKQSAAQNASSASSVPINATTNLTTNKRHSIGFEAADTPAPMATLNAAAAGFDASVWKSLQDLRDNFSDDGDSNVGQFFVRAADGINSEPDLLNPNLPANASPFRRAWGQSSFRTPRTDKHSHRSNQLQQQIADQAIQHLSPLVRRASSMTASDNDVYIKSMHNGGNGGGYRDELKQARSQHQIATAAATFVAATRNCNVAHQTSATGNNDNNNIQPLKSTTQLKSAATTTAATDNSGVTGVAAWGTAFEKLLDDPAGMHTFAEFLKKEFSAENIYFWTACERFRALDNSTERAAQAMAIFSKYLANGAPEPVNVDSQARNLTQDKLQSAEPDIFAQAQKQIFNLMKFDSYQRFIRSDMYKSCLEAEEKRHVLPYKGEDLDDLLRTPSHQQQVVVTQSASASKLKKSASNAEDRCRKSLLPWHRKTSSNKAQQRDASDGANATENKSSHKLSLLSSSHSLKVLAPPPATHHNSQSDVHSSRSSLSSFDGLTGASILPGTCRVVLADASTTMVQVRANETVGQLVERLLEKRGLNYQYYDVVAKGTTKSIDLHTSSQTLVGKDVLIEQRVAFKLDLPDRKVISVKSKPKKQLHEVVRPILHKYNYDFDAVQVVRRETQEPIDLTLTVTYADGQRLQAVWLKPPPLLQSVDYQNSNGLNGCAAKMAKPAMAAAGKGVVSFQASSAKQSNGIVVHNPSENGLLLTTHPMQSALDEITNKVFTELMQGKVEAAASAEKQQPLKSVNSSKANDLASLKSDDCVSETSSIFERIRRRETNIAGLKLKLKKRSTSGQRAEETHHSNNPTAASNGQSMTTASSAAASTAVGDTKKPIIAKLKAGVKLQMPERIAENQDELLEGLKRAQLARLEDQRGTEINFELPDFLKNKENLNASKLRKARANLSPINKSSNNVAPTAITQSHSALATPSSYTTTNSKTTQAELPSVQQERPQPAPRLSITNKLKTSLTVTPIKPMEQPIEEAAISSLENMQAQSPLQSQGNTSNSSIESEYAGAIAAAMTTSCYKGPPPLPPKPKVLPIKPSNWGAGAATTASASNSSTNNSPTTASMSLPSLPVPAPKNYATVSLVSNCGGGGGVTTVVGEDSSPASLLLHVASRQHCAANEIVPRKTHLSLAAEPQASARCAYLEEPSSSFV